jgi:hypothetical protein
MVSKTAWRWKENPMIFGLSFANADKPARRCGRRVNHVLDPLVSAGNHRTDGGVLSRYLTGALHAG